MTYTGTKFHEVVSELIRGIPTFEPVDPSETADHLRVGDDPRIVSLISDYLLAAREWVENEVQVSLPTRTVTLYLDEFPCWEVEIRLPPLQSVTSIVYLDTNGDSQTLSASLYRVDTTGKPGRITPAYGQAWPTTYCVTRAVTITAICGYTDTTVPACAKQAMRVLAGMMFHNNGLLCEDGLDSVRRMLDPLRWEGYR